jgi:hypothetical protein
MSSGTPQAGSSVLVPLPVLLPILFILNCIVYIVLVIVLYLPPACIKKGRFCLTVLTLFKHETVKSI